MKGLISIVESLCFEKWGLKKKKALLLVALIFGHKSPYLSTLFTDEVFHINSYFVWEGGAVSRLVILPGAMALTPHCFRGVLLPLPHLMRKNG